MHAVEQVFFQTSLPSRVYGQQAFLDKSCCFRVHGMLLNICITSTLPFVCQNRGVNYSKKSVRRFLGLENPGNFSRDSGIFLPEFKGFWDFFQLIFSKYFPNIVIILRILFGFFQVFYAIFRDFLGFWDSGI